MDVLFGFTFLKKMYYTGHSTPRMLYYVYASTMHKMKKCMNIFFTLQNVFLSFSK